MDQYPDLIRLEHLLGHPADERKFLLAYAKAAPDDPKAVLLAGSLLLAANHTDDAVDVYRAGMKALPDNQLIQVELGGTLLRMGNKEEAVPLIARALDKASDPSVLNDGAYALLNAGSSASLPLAESSARKAVEMLESELAEIPIESVNARAFSQTNLLLAAWDTLGWVYFAEGKNEPAEQYVRASWQSAAHGEQGLHLGEILEKKGDLPGAMQVYEMALSQIPHDSAAPWATDLHDRENALRKKGVAVQDAHPDRALQARRTFHLARPAGVKGSGIFLLQASATKTAQVAMVSGSEELRSMAMEIGTLDLGLAVPRDSHALLLRSGVLFCSTEPTCELVLTPPEIANVR